MNEEKIESPELREYRLKARAWLAENLPRPEQQGEALPGPYEEADDPGPAEQAAAQRVQAKLYEAGYAGFTFPVEYGGQGLTLDHERVFFEEAAGYDVPTGAFGVSINILGATLVAFGTHEQKLAHIPNILSGKERWLQFLSEPSGGSDLGGLLTSATRDGDSFVLNGQKIWSTGAHLSNFALCPVRTRWDVPKHKGISVLIVDLKTPGVEIHRIKQINGGAEFCQEFFTDAVIPASNLVGEENEGWRVARGLLEIEHAWAGRAGGGNASGAEAMSSLVSLAKRKGLDQDRGVRRQIVGVYAAAEVHKMVSVRVSNGMATGKLLPGYGSLLKLSNDILGQRRAELGLSLAGGEGVAWGGDQDGSSRWSQAYLSSRSASIAGGTDEIQRNNVSERVLGLPREPSFDRDIPFNQVPHN
jgi:alkylation response protein AidB-like acyl-CoA dehydrogenase